MSWRAARRATARAKTERASARFHAQLAETPARYRTRIAYTWRKALRAGVPAAEPVIRHTPFLPVNFNLPRTTLQIFGVALRVRVG